MSYLRLRAPRTTIFLLTFIISGALSLRAQQSPASSNNLVDIPFTVTDKGKHSVTTLRKEDVRVLDDGTPQEIIAFQRQTGQPLALAILIDTSMSQERTLPNQKLAAAAFADSIIRQSSDQAAIITFSHQPRLEQALTSDLMKLRQGIDRAEFIPPLGYVGGGMVVGAPPPMKNASPAGSTAIWDAVWVASDEVLSQTSDKTRCAIILITDGQDTSSVKKMSEATERALKARTVVYTIGIGDDYYGGVNKEGLQKLSERTGGHAFFPKKITDLQAVFEAIKQELDSQYVISYAPAKKSGKDDLRKVRIEIINPELRKQGLHLSHQQGYSLKRG